MPASNLNLVNVRSIESTNDNKIKTQKNLFTSVPSVHFNMIACHCEQP